MKKNILFNGLIMSSIFTALVGCASVTPTLPGAENVTITSDSVSRNCLWKGKVSAVNGSRSMGGGQHSSLKEDEFSRLRNQAFQLGANTVVLSPSSGMTDKKHWAAKAAHKTAASHIYTGNAYRCPR